MLGRSTSIRMGCRSIRTGCIRRNALRTFFNSKAFAVLGEFLTSASTQIDTEWSSWRIPTGASRSISLSRYLRMKPVAGFIGPFLGMRRFRSWLRFNVECQLLDSISAGTWPTAPVRVVLMTQVPVLPTIASAHLSPAISTPDHCIPHIRQRCHPMKTKAPYTLEGSVKLSRQCQVNAINTKAA